MQTMKVTNHINNKNNGIKKVGGKKNHLWKLLIALSVTTIMWVFLVWKQVFALEQKLVNSSLVNERDFQQRHHDHTMEAPAPVVVDSANNPTTFGTIATIKDNLIKGAQPTGAASAISWQDQIIQELETLSIRYFVYNESDFSILRPVNGSKHHRYGAPLFVQRFGPDNLSDRDILRALQKHPLRTHNSQEASVFILPILPGEILTWQPGKTKDAKNKRRWNSQDENSANLFDQTFTELMNHPLFQQHGGGNNHILLSTALVTFHRGDKGKVPMLARWYNALQNVTVAMSFDVNAAWDDYQRHGIRGHEYEVMARVMNPVVRSSFSLGLGCQVTSGLDLEPASMDKFDKSTYHIFYQTRTSESQYNSTIYRHAPLTRTNISQQIYNTTTAKNAVRKNCIGYGLPNRWIWKDKFSSSQFCLVIRGDTPHSHSLLRSVRVGCIPVVVSDWYPIFSPTLKSSLPRMDDYCIFILEHDYIRDPQGTLDALQYLPRSIVQEKIANLQLAQRIIFVDHRQSLFVPAFLKEATDAMRSNNTMMES